MRVVINQMVLAGVRTGIGHYTAQLMRCLRQQAGHDRLDGAPRRYMLRAMDVWGHLRPYIKPTGVSTGPIRWTWRTAAFRVLRAVGHRFLRHHIRSVYSRNSCDLYHEPNFIPVAPDLPTVVTLHDLSVLHHPEWHPRDRVAHFEKNFHKGLRNATHFLSISESARQEIIRTLHIRPEQVTRTYMGVRPGLGPMPREQVQQALKKMNLPSQYLLYLGTIEPRKNVLTVLKAYCSLPAAYREKWPLLLVGGWGWNSEDVAEYLDQVGKDSGVMYTGYVPDEHVPALYNGARALVFPSFYEGFGMPPVEMLACGGAVLASTADALVETVGNQAHLVDPLDVDGWRDALYRVGEDEEWWQSLRQGAIEAARPYTWDQCAADTWKVYRKLAA